jgi:hypothetical protein
MLGVADVKSLIIIVEVKSERLRANGVTEYRATSQKTKNFSKEGKQNMVYVISKNGNPLMPCENVIARLLLKEGKARCWRKTPFTIKLLNETTEYTQPLTHGLDTGSSVVGSAVVDEKGNVVYMSEITIRNDITRNMTQRSKYRRNRRNRKTRYRPERWLYRFNSFREDRFSPTMISKINSHLKEIKFVRSILPITNLILETGTFDPHALKNPEVLTHKWMYQHGVNYGYANTRAYVLTRDNYVCQNCKGKSKNKRLEVHHIQFKNENGSDDEKNLLTLCETCHDAVHKGKLKLKGGKKKTNLKHATQMNLIRTQLLKQLECIETFGYITKEHRQLADLPKEHYYDAVVIASEGRKLTFKTNRVLYKMCVADGDYQRTKGVRSQMKLPKGKTDGFLKFDKVKYLGSKYFIKGRMSDGYAILMDIHGNKVKFEHIPKFKLMKRVNARKSWIMQEQCI